MEDFFEGRKNVAVYTVFFDTFVPCATKKTTWERQIAKAGIKTITKKLVSLCTVSDEAFALLLMENSFDRWFDLHIQGRKEVEKHPRGSKASNFESDIPPLYTRGGIKYKTANINHSVKGWSEEGLNRFNLLFDHVKQDRMDHESFELDWLESRREAQESKSTPKRAKRQAVTTRSELFESEEAEKVTSLIVSNSNLGVDNDSASEAD